MTKPATTEVDVGKLFRQRHPVNPLVVVAKAILTNNCQAIKSCQEALHKLIETKKVLNKVASEHKAASKAFTEILLDARRSVDWLEGRDPKSDFSFYTVCEMLNLFPEKIVNGVNAMLDADLMLALNSDNDFVCPLCKHVH